MKTHIKKEGDTIVVSMNGKLDFEAYLPLREDLGKIIDHTRKDSVAKKIIFDLGKLEFVGSSGISSFIQVLREFNAVAPSRPRYCNVRSEFQRVIKAFDDDALFDFYDNEERARRSFDQ